MEKWLENLPNDEEKEALQELVNIMAKHGLVLKKREEWEKITKIMILWYETNGTILIYKIEQNQPYCINSLRNVHLNKETYYNQVRAELKRRGYDLDNLEIWAI